MQFQNEVMCDGCMQMVCSIALYITWYTEWQSHPQGPDPTSQEGGVWPGHGDETGCTQCGFTHKLLHFLFYLYIHTQNHYPIYGKT